MVTDATIDLVTLVVEDQDEAIEFYVDTLGFELHQDESYGVADRWIEIRPPGSAATITVKTPEMFDEREGRHRRALIGTSPQLTFRVDDCQALYRNLRAADVPLDGEPSKAPWGISLTARDPSGNPVVFTEAV